MLFQSFDILLVWRFYHHVRNQRFLTNRLLKQRLCCITNNTSNWFSITSRQQCILWYTFFSISFKNQCCFFFLLLWDFYCFNGYFTSLYAITWRNWTQLSFHLTIYRVFSNRSVGLLDREFQTKCAIPLPRQSEWGTKPAALRTLSTERDLPLYYIVNQNEI